MKKTHTWQRLGRVIRTLRDAKGLTREELAAKTKLSAVYLKKLEAGDRTSPSFEALDAIARALGAKLSVTLTQRRRRKTHARSQS